MNFKLELPEGTILVNRTDLKEVLQEMLVEVQGDNVKEEIMTIQEAADYLKVCAPTVRKLMAEKELPFFQRGQVIRLNRKDIKKWMQNNPKE
ncbi:helix-turn-helix domain-containing protein [Heyndrickxia sporothermodurans]|uniref:Helix-turn-helix domain-containing protein n=1 Tax=Heyndrickxia sporothermodurans TaxID=46224 RepID=A0A150LFD3_9BACI|nr:helix-turn-helix domain-containing protein [Heyndrickxia sporothermodurans]KYD11048.1 hypothetical protein B4102_0108 [Heyndrickxia sporothermodurans]MED3649609.1 helix-turn-helix domain-containing protein [Heyndrickxia sporothermodurans]MED3699895.1 helix-turn-helix domain-containing protein [Heyndrickxia sporothermodurans]